MLILFFVVGCNPSSFRIESANSLSDIVNVPGDFALTSVTQGNSSLIVSWNSSSDASTYVVKYGTTTGIYTTTASTNATSPFEVMGLTNGVDYFFSVEAVNTAGTKLSTNELSETVIFFDDFNSLNLISSWQMGTELTAYSLGDNSAPGSILFSSDGTGLVIGNVTAAAADSNYYGITLETRQDFNFTNSWVSTDMVSPFATDLPRYQEVGLWVINDLGDGWEMYKSDNNLAYGEWPGTQSSIPFNSCFGPQLTRHLV